MRTLVIPALLLCPAIASAQTVTREDDGSARVVVTATRVARLTPDRVSVYAIIEGSAETAPDAAQRADRKLQAVTEAARQLARVEIAIAAPFGVSPAPNYGGYPGQAAANPFVGRHVLRVQPARVDQLMSLTAALIAAGATSVTPPYFEASAADSARRVKFAEALSVARADAEAVASGLGMRLGTIANVTVNPGPTQFNTQQFVNFSRPFEMGMSGAGSMPEVSVMTTVTVTYRLLPR